MAQHRKDQPADTLEELESIGERLVQWVGANPVIVLGRRRRDPARGRQLRRLSRLEPLPGQFRFRRAGDGPQRFRRGDGRQGRRDVEVPGTREPGDRQGRPHRVRRQVPRGREGMERAPRRARSRSSKPVRSSRSSATPTARSRLFQQAAAEAPADITDSRRDRVALGHLLERRATSRRPPRRTKPPPPSPDFPLRDDALADAARCWAEAGKPDQALAIYQRLKTESPDLQLAPHVEARLEELEARNFGVAAPSSDAAADTQP